MHWTFAIVKENIDSLIISNIGKLFSAYLSPKRIEGLSQFFVVTLNGRNAIGSFCVITNHKIVQLRGSNNPIIFDSASNSHYSIQNGLSKAISTWSMANKKNMSLRAFEFLITKKLPGISPYIYSAAISIPIKVQILHQLSQHIFKVSITENLPKNNKSNLF